ncbi:MAG TPA: FkbM family methyltransferase [Sphingomicrobium sp.]|nr:FkbM family methyltransferase [Sphingomicrobium sp.]
MKRLLKPLQRFINSVPALHHLLRSIWVPPPSIRQHLAFRGSFTVVVQPGVSFQLASSGTAVENELFWKGYAGSWERRSLELWREFARSADYVLDVGANTGVYALAAQALNPRAKILAIEPAPRIYAQLRRNIELNSFPILSAEVAASSREGTATFYDFEGEHEYSASLEPGMGGSVETIVPVTTLDKLLDRHGFPRVDLVKIDVERHEPAALRGFRNTLERDRPAILIEVLDNECRQGIADALDGLGYEWSGPYDRHNFLLRAR